MTSFDVIRQCKKRFIKGTKIGHLGTLDPMAAGVLPVAVGKATRVIEYVQENKEYIAVVTLGGISDTQDAWGNIKYPNQKVAVNEPALKMALNHFTGTISQIPPMYSAVHHQGKRLYELARKGLVVERVPRQVRIHHLELIDYDQMASWPLVTIRVECSKGTYIRTLAHDIGEKLGTGGYLSSLVRSKSSNFSLENAVSLTDLIMAKDISQYLLPIDFPLVHLASYDLEPEKALAVMQGRSIKCLEFADNQIVKMYLNNELIAIARYDSEGGILKPEKVLKQGD